MNINIDNEFCRQQTQNSLKIELNKIERYYMQVYDEYYSSGSRDSAFLKDLVDSLIGISSVLEVYVEHKGINSGYAIEKLNNSRSYINACISYFENKESKEKENE